MPRNGEGADNQNPQDPQNNQNQPGGQEGEHHENQGIDLGVNQNQVDQPQNGGNELEDDDDEPFHFVENYQPPVQVPIAQPAGETYFDMIERLRGQRPVKAQVVAEMMAAGMLQQHAGIGAAANPQAVALMAVQLQKQPSFDTLMADERTRELAENGFATDLITLLADKETQRLRDLDRYARPGDWAKQDAEFLKRATAAIRKAVPKKEQQGRRFKEMMKRLDEARTLAEQGLPLSGEKGKQLVDAVKKYNDGGKSIPGGKKTATASAEAMTVLNRYMPGPQFGDYCDAINRSRQADALNHPRHVEPASFGPERLAGARTGRELLAQIRTAAYQRGSMTLQECAAVAAIHKLSRGNPNVLVNPGALKLQQDQMMTKGSPLRRTLEDPEAMKSYQAMASKGKYGEMGEHMLADARLHSIRTAQGQVNRSIRALTSGPVNQFFAAQHLANILAAREFAAQSPADQQITNGAFRARAEQLQEDPAFQRFAQRYATDPTYRDHTNQELIADSSATSLSLAFQQSQAHARRAQQPQAEAPAQQAQAPVQPQAGV